jgi:hypothetical protein
MPGIGAYVDRDTQPDTFGKSLDIVVPPGRGFRVFNHCHKNMAQVVVLQEFLLGFSQVPHVFAGIYRVLPYVHRQQVMLDHRLVDAVEHESRDLLNRHT